MNENIRVERIFFENDQIIQSVHQCFIRAQKSVIKSAVFNSIKFILKKAIYRIILLLIVILNCMIFSFMFKIRYFVSASITALVSLIILILYQYYIHRKVWTEYVHSVLESSEISYKRANMTFSKEKNAFFVVLNKKNDVISIGGILADDEKFNSLKSWAPKFRDQDGLLVRVATQPSFHCKGYGREIVRHCIDFGKSLSLKCIKLCLTNKQKSALKLYKSLGFRVVKTHKIETLPDFYVFLMQLEI